MSEQIKATKTEILEHWSMTDLAHAHALLDEFERANYMQMKKLKKR